MIRRRAYAVTGSTSYSSSQNYLTPVGAYTASASPYGASTWAATCAMERGDSAARFGACGGVRGKTDGSMYLDSSYRYIDDPTNELGILGFRVALVPEPSTAVLAILSLPLLALWGWRRRRSR